MADMLPAILLWPRQSDECRPEQQLHGGLAAHRAADTQTKGHSVDLRSLVCAGNRRHHQHRAENHSRLRRISRENFIRCNIPRPAIPSSRAAFNNCCRRCR